MTILPRAVGSPIMWKTGHSLMKAKLKAESAVLAGEMSGHMFFADRYFGFDDAIYASCRLVEILAKTKQVALQPGRGSSADDGDAGDSCGLPRRR